MHEIMIRLFALDARFFCLSAAQNAQNAQNAPPASCLPAGGAFCAADKEKNSASCVNTLPFGYLANFKEAAQEVKG